MKTPDLLGRWMVLSGEDGAMGYGQFSGAI